MKTKIFLTAYLFIQPILLFSQQGRQVLLYNVGFGAVTSAVGAVINKPQHANWKPYFFKGLWQGSIGGLLNYSGKKSLYLVNKQQNFTYAWTGKILHVAGTSIMENAALNEPFLQNWNIDFGPVRFDFSVNGKKPFRARLLSQTVVGTIQALSAGTYFDAKTSLATGTLAFKSKKELIGTSTESSYGFAYGGTIAYATNWNTYITVPHEIIHTYQFRDYQIFNTWLKPLTCKIKTGTLQKIFTHYVYFDAPYFLGFYSLEGYHAYPYYYRNFYEFEAQRLATNRYVQIQ